MDDDTLKQRAAQAWAEVKAHANYDLRGYLGRVYQLNMERAGDKISIRVCPLCQGKDCSALLKGKSGGYLFKCHHNQCSSDGKAMGIEAFIQHTQGCDWPQARRALHELTGIPDPYQEAREAHQSRKPGRPAATPAAATPAAQDSPAAEEPGIPAPQILHVPDTQRNLYEEAWAVMTLSEAGRRELREKRGFDNAWIDALGIRTSRRENRPLLEAMLDNFPPNELLRSGIAVRDRKTWKLKIAESLCGRIYDSDEETGQGQWRDFENIIIPYINDQGRIIGLRPHKRGLSNGAFREETASEFYEKEYNNLRLIYGEAFLTDRPERHAHRCIICEGELKAAALRRCGIPAIGFQGIHFLRQNKETRQAVRDLVKMLRKHKIREVVVVFDNEDKSHKPPHQRFEAELYARYTALMLEDEGFKAFFGMLPDEWREGGEKLPDGRIIKSKADWDGRLAYHLRKARGNHARALANASEEFEKVLAHRSGKNPAVRQAPRQMDWMADFKEDVIGQEMNKLRHEPDCFVGGKHELEVASEITGYCHEDYRDKLNIENLAKELRKTLGGYYMLKRPPEKTEARVIETKMEVKDKLEKATDEDEVRALRAALLACNTILYHFPKPFSDFTALSKYKVLVTEPDGSVRKDRLCVFIDRNGRRSKPVQINGEKMGSSQELRKVFLRLDGYHWSGGQAEADAFVNLLDVQNYQKTIIEIDSYGQHRDSGIFLLGDCAWAEGDGFLFPDKNGIIWYRSVGYKNADALDAFCHKPPVMFPENPRSPRLAYEAIDWDTERAEIQDIWKGALMIAARSFGDMSGLAMVSGILQYLAHPETLSLIGGKPGLWVQGAKGSGKTQTIKAFMRMIGYIENYGMVGLTGTKVGIERSLSQFDCLPVHLDEWRNARAPDELVGFITNAFNGIAIAKGTATGSKSIRLSRAATIPVITGEDMTTDAALLSRYLRLTMSASSRQGTQEDQQETFQSMLDASGQFYRIGRYLMRERHKYGARVVELAKEFASHKDTIASIRDARAREVIAICHSALIAAQEMIVGKPFTGQEGIAKWFLEHGKVNADEIEKDIFRLRWFSDCVQLVTSESDHRAKHFLQVRRGHILQDGSIQILKGNNADIELAGKGRRLILVAPDELFPAYQRDQAKRRETVPINIRNIRSELRREPYWIPAPKTGTFQHRFTVDGFRPSKWWVMDYETAGDLRDIISPIYEKFLCDHGLELGDDDEPRQIDDTTPLI
jgi:hypothetical protein